MGATRAGKSALYILYILKIVNSDNKPISLVTGLHLKKRARMQLTSARVRALRTCVFARACVSMHMRAYARARACVCVRASNPVEDGP